MFLYKRSIRRFDMKLESTHNQFALFQVYSMLEAALATIFNNKYSYQSMFQMKIEETKPQPLLQLVMN